MSKLLNSFLKSFNSPYDFYNLPESEKKYLFGKPFKVKDSDQIYFPVDLHPDEFNYGEQQGLIFVTQVFAKNDLYTNWFRIAAFSPDDLDIDLDFSSDNKSLSELWRQQAIEFLSNPVNLQNIFYTNVLRSIQKLTGAGERTS